MTTVKEKGNVFAELGFPDPETHALKAALAHRIATLIKRESLTQADAAKRMGISQPDVSKMLKGQFRPFSVERLMRFLNDLGQDVEIAVRTPKCRRRAESRAYTQPENRSALMSLVDAMLEQLATARRIVEDGNEFVPAWWITTPEGAYLVLTRFDPDKEGQRERALLLISRFMTWKLATSFVLAAEMWMGGGLMRSAEEALLALGVSRHERRGAIQKISRKPAISFGPVQWLEEDQVDETYFKLLPSGASEMTIEEITELSAIFGEGGELQAERLS